MVNFLVYTCGAFALFAVMGVIDSIINLFWW